MDEYTFYVKLQVTVEAYDKHDAEEILTDNFGIGEDGGVLIESSNFKYVRTTAKPL